MDNKTYASLVNEGSFPEEIKVPLDSPFVDERGKIQNLWLGGSGSVTLITSKKGSVRAEHYHKGSENGDGGDWHSTYILSGSIDYSEADINGSNRKEYHFKAGEQFFSPPMKWHRMSFPEDTTFITFNGISKFHERYEEKVVRVKFDK